jgi:hypothetical protein
VQPPYVVRCFRPAVSRLGESERRDKVLYPVTSPHGDGPMHGRRADFGFGSIVTGSSLRQVLPCPPCRESGSKFGALVTRHRSSWVHGDAQLDRPVIQEDRAMQATL